MGKAGGVGNEVGNGSPGTSAVTIPRKAVVGEMDRCSVSLGEGEVGRLVTGDSGYERYIDFTGWRVKRNMPLWICQNIRRVTNIWSHPRCSSSSPLPTEVSKLIINPILSSFGIMFLLRKTPSLLILMRQSPLGLASAGADLVLSLSIYGAGSVC